MIEHDFREVVEHEGHQIAERETHIDFQTRYNVLMGWLMDWVIDEISLYNKDFHFKTFMKQCDHLGKRFPIHEELKHIDEIRFVFWHRFQYKIKTMKNQIQKQQRGSVNVDLKRMGFL